MMPPRKAPLQRADAAQQRGGQGFEADHIAHVEIDDLILQGAKTPAMPVIAPAIRKLTPIVLLTSMPSSAAMPRSCAAAR